MSGSKIVGRRRDRGGEWFSAARFVSIVLAMVAVTVIGACSHDSGTATEPGDGSGPGPILYTVSFDSALVDSASVPVATPIAVKVHVTKSSAPAANTPVAWTITNGSGTVSADTTTTDALGAATVTWTLGDTAGVNALMAKAGDGSATIRAVGTAGAAATLSKHSIDSVTVVAGASLPLTVKVADRFGNGIPGATVAWSTTAGTLSATSSTSGRSGNADVVLTTSAAGAQPATYRVTATLPGFASVTFTITSR